MQNTILAVSEKFLLGVNYWPARKFTRMWAQFDAAEIDRDFATIADLRLRLVRFFLLWPDFKPEPERIDDRQMGNLERVFASAERHHLLLLPTVIVGLMSGPCWIPAWTMSGLPNNRPAVYLVGGEVSPNRPRDLFGDDPPIFEAERLLVRTVVSRLHRHPALWGWDLCNEISLVQVPSTEAAEHWLRTLTGDVHAIDLEHPVTAGFLVHGGDGRGFRRESHRLVDVASEHAYPLYDPASLGPTDAGYVGRRIDETHAASGKPVLLAEFGMCTSPEPGTGTVTSLAAMPGGQLVTLVDEQEAAAFVKVVVPAARVAGAIGALIWCFADYDPSLYDDFTFTAFPHERYFGIFDAHGRLKATGAALGDLAE